MKSCDFSLQIPNEPTESHATRAHCSTMRFCAHTHGNEFKYLCHFFVVVHTYFSTVSSYTHKKYMDNITAATHSRDSNSLEARLPEH